MSASIEKAIGKLEEQGRWVQKEIVEMKKDVKTLLTWRWKIYGVSATITVVMVAVSEVVIAHLK